MSVNPPGAVQYPVSPSLTSPGLDPGGHETSRPVRGWPGQARPRRRRWRSGHNQSGGRAAGFTLIEVLVALAVVGLALGALAGVFSNGLMAHETASDAEAALALAETQLTLAGAALRPGSTGGDFAGRFAWQTTIAAYDDRDKSDKAADAPDTLPHLYRIAVTVAWRDGHRSRQVALSTLRLGPAPVP